MDGFWGIGGIGHFSFPDLDLEVDHVTIVSASGNHNPDARLLTLRP